MKRLLLMITLLVLSIVLLAAYAWRQSGVSISGLSWQPHADQRGFYIKQWTWKDVNDCVKVSGQSTHIAWAWPLKLFTDIATVHDCSSEPMTAIPALKLPTLPNFTLNINALQLSQLPLAQLQLTQQQQHWQINAQTTDLVLTAELQQDLGEWTLQAQGQANVVHPEMTGEVSLSGSGSWTDTLNGFVTWHAKDFGHLSQPQRAQLKGDLTLDGEVWQLKANLTDELALSPDWRISSLQPVNIQGQLITINQVDAELLIRGDKDQAHITLSSDGIDQGQGHIQLSGALAQGKLDVSWQSGTLTLAPTALAILQQYQLTLPQAIDLPMQISGQATIPLRVNYDGIQLRSDKNQLQWQGADWTWQGDLSAQGRLQGLPFTAQAKANISEQGQRIELQPGMVVQTPGGLINQYLIRPISLRSNAPLHVVLCPALSIRGEMAISADGVTSSQLNMPASKGWLKAQGNQLNVLLAIESWQSTINAQALLSDLLNKPKGSFQISSRLSRELSRDLGLGFNLQAGNAEGTGRWNWDKVIYSDSQIKLSEVDADLGSMLVRGLNANVNVKTRDSDVSIASEQAVTITTANVGIPITDIKFLLQGQPEQWQLSQVQAKLLGGKATMSAIGWPNSSEQTLALEWLDLKQVTALQSNPNPDVSLSGYVSGSFPLTLNEGKLSIREGRLNNQQPLRLKLNPSASFKAMASSNMAVQFALDTISELDVSVFDARLAMTENGWATLTASLSGVNPRAGSQPIVLNYRHEENILDLLRSLRISEEISERVLKGQAR
ncbi:MAG: YdbH domain-containing protein [Moraxellaceae bacterium]|nr:YdbH domain-containing protein [Moraxellaceae bacterium]